MANGIAGDEFGTGKYELTAAVLPKLLAIKQQLNLGEAALPIDIYFVHTAEINDLPFQAKPVAAATETIQGIFGLRINEPIKLIQALNGQAPALAQLTQMFAQQLELCLQITLKEDLASNTAVIHNQPDEVSFRMLQRAVPAFAGVGLALIGLKIGSGKFTTPRPSPAENTPIPPQPETAPEINPTAENQHKPRPKPEPEIKPKTDNQPRHSGYNPMSMAEILQQNIMGQMDRIQSGFGGLNLNFGNKPATAQTESANDKILRQLKELGELKNAGILTEAEFEEKKKQLLAAFNPGS
jgi:hypothetical protein